MQTYRLVDFHIRRWRFVLGTILASCLLLASLASNVWATSTASPRLDSTEVHLASLKMKTTTAHHLRNHTAFLEGKLLGTIKKFQNIQITHRGSASMVHLFPLPVNFSGYSVALRSVSPLVVSQSSIPVYLPIHVCSTCRHVAMGYTAQNTDHGYHIAFSVPSPSLRTGQAVLTLTTGAYYLGTVWGLPIHAPWIRLVRPLHQYLPLNNFGRFNKIIQTEPSRVHTLSLSLPGSRIATEKIATEDGGSIFEVVWHQNSWRIAVQAVGILPSEVQSFARSIARTLEHHTLSGRDGQAVFGEYSDTPSEATYVLGSARYFIYAMGGSAAVWAEHMKQLPP